ncbi:hypothetical protein SKAU_G00161760 [Synaphobranchus kaupii]|uniref:Uncharacterized protein n=1 Tax=Synaphobranchus kaupii TaxID=118154 RepID=A0A9Q1FIT0_SYNKA|nr:hypothetical protein SKAU_G00161760 [Synaphobranchus kaupii]
MYRVTRDGTTPTPQTDSVALHCRWKPAQAYPGPLPSCASAPGRYLQGKSMILLCPLLKYKSFCSTAEGKVITLRHSTVGQSEVITPSHCNAGLPSHIPAKLHCRKGRGHHSAPPQRGTGPVRGSAALRRKTQRYYRQIKPHRVLHYRQEAAASPLTHSPLSGNGLNPCGARLASLRRRLQRRPRRSGDSPSALGTKPRNLSAAPR